MIFNLSDEKYSDFKTIIRETYDELSNLKIIDHQIKDLMELKNEKDLFYEFIFFANFPKLITLNLDHSFQDNKYILNGFNRKKTIFDKIQFNKRIYRIIIHKEIFLLSKIENVIDSLIRKLEDVQLIKLKIKEINQSYQILIQILFFVSKLYEEKIYDINKILIFFNILIIFINKNKIIEDKFLKIKNIIFLRLLFEKYFGYFYIILMNNKDNKDDIISFFNFMIKVLNSNELNIWFNYQILTKNKIIENFLATLLNNIDFNRNIDIYNKYKEELINSFTCIYKINTDQFNFFELLINQNKKSFINLANYKTRKDYIINDLYIQNFYIELLQNLFSTEKNILKKNSITEENYFIFNGHNSKMSFELKDFSLNNSFIFFSFQLSKDVLNASSKIFPLINFQSQADKENIIKLYIQKDDNIYKLYLYQEKGEKKKKIEYLDKLGNIQVKNNYLILIKFSNKKIGIYLIILQEKEERYFEEKEIFETDKNVQILKIGYDDKNNEYFKGHIGSFIMMKK